MNRLELARLALLREVFLSGLEKQDSRLSFTPCFEFLKAGNKFLLKSITPHFSYYRTVFLKYFQISNIFQTWFHL